MKQVVLFLLITIACSGFGYRAINNPPLRWVIVNGCSLTVDGSTNINKFSCGITNYANPDTIAITKSTSQLLHLSGCIKLEVKNFDCHNAIMTADLRKTLKSKEFPGLAIRFISLNRYPVTGGSPDGTTGQVTIELAGVSKQFDVNYKVVTAEKSFIQLVGSRVVHFSDFKITPPRKLGGMIKTNNELSVVFTLKMKVLE